MNFKQNFFERGSAHQKLQNICVKLCNESKTERIYRCWKAFAQIHEIIRTPDILFHATCEIIQEFVKDNVIYLELRTTPKKIHEIPSKQVYIDTVINAIKYVTYTSGGGIQPLINY